MPAKRIRLLDVEHILEYYYAHEISMRRIAGILGVGHSKVSRTMNRLKLHQLIWPLPDWATDGVLESLLWPRTAEVGIHTRPVPNWADVYLKLSQDPELTIRGPWREYIEANPNGYRYSRFCDLYRAWRNPEPDPPLPNSRRTGKRQSVDHPTRKFSAKGPTHRPLWK